MAALPADSMDAVLLAPMYLAPDKAAPGFELLRALADHRPLQADAVDAALHCAPRLVVKWPRGTEPPQALRQRPTRVILGSRVAYWVVERS